MSTAFTYQTSGFNTNRSPTGRQLLAQLSYRRFFTRSYGCKIVYDVRYVRLSTSFGATANPTISANITPSAFKNSCQENSNLVKIWQQYQALLIATGVFDWLATANRHNSALWPSDKRHVTQLRHTSHCLT
jgi:hypothetical protein